MKQKKCPHCGGARCDVCFRTGYVPDYSRDDVRPSRTGGRHSDSGGFPVVGFAIVMVIGLIWVNSSRRTGPGSSPGTPAGGAKSTSSQTSSTESSAKTGRRGLEIEKLGAMYKYYDQGFMKSHGLTGRNALGYTLSTTPPFDEVEFIVEYSTVYQEGAGLDGKVVSRGRRIPRDQVRPVKFTQGNSIMTRGGRVMAERFYYVPPSTAGDREKREAR